RVFNDDGTPVTGEFTVNSPGLSLTRKWPMTAVIDGDKFAVTWIGSAGVRGRVMQVTGNTIQYLCDEFAVNSCPGILGGFRNPQATSTGDGRFRVGYLKEPPGEETRYVKWKGYDYDQSGCAPFDCGCGYDPPTNCPSKEPSEECPNPPLFCDCCINCNTSCCQCCDPEVLDGCFMDQASYDPNFARKAYPSIYASCCCQCCDPEVLDGCFMDQASYDPNFARKAYPSIYASCWCHNTAIGAWASKCTGTTFPQCVNFRVMKWF
ncbi:MAG: hypothetical protein FJ088_09390, partial [Deltaproteobacteria bacterium]|nr:hypothetical protein [Deltaproteobacteria bacterium]